MITKDRYAVLAGKIIRELRRNAGYSRAEFTRLVGCKSEQQLYRYETGINKIDIDTLVLSLEVLNIDSHHFFERLRIEDLNNQADKNIDIDCI
ncbi:helix-turn-helix domain-containing protein [Providencia rettgeri]